MKKLILMLAWSIIVLAACNNEKDVNALTDDSDEAEIKISLNTGGDGLTTKTARPLQSSEAFSTVSKVVLKVYEGTDASATDITTTVLPGGADVISWGKVSTPVEPGTTDNLQSQVVKLKALDASKNYTIISYGFSGETADLAYNITGDGKVADGFTATFKGGASQEEEVFAGRITFTTDADKKITSASEVVMKRQIAGLLGYFKNIPILYPNASNVLTPVAKVVVKARQSASAFTFPSVANGPVVNAAAGTTTATAVAVLTYNLPDLIQNYTTQVNGATGNPSAKFVIAAKAAAENAGAATVENSVLAGKFLIPFAAHATDATFTVELQDNANNTLRSWEVLLQNPGSVDSKKYPVNRNYFYSIGKKLKAATTTGTTDPSEPNPTDPDEAIDLSMDNVITLTVNDAWETIYELGLGE